MAAEGRMGGRMGTPEAGPAGYLPTLSGRVPAVSTSTQRWAGAGEAATSFPSTWMDHTLATRARRDGQLVRVKPEHLLEGLAGGEGWLAALPE